MVKRMLIDATHPEETRVVVLDGTRLDEFDVESSTKKQIKGNIYLAKVVRVEPSLQAAFVEYGGNRHGFLAFSEIHPDYYQIPVADRERLLADAERHHHDDDHRDDGNDRHHRRESRHHADDDHGHHDDSEHAPQSTSEDHADEPATQSAEGYPVSETANPADNGDTLPLAFIPPAISTPAPSEDVDDEPDAAPYPPSYAVESVPEQAVETIAGPESEYAGTPSDSAQSEEAPPPSSEATTPHLEGGDHPRREGEITLDTHADGNKTSGVETVGGEDPDDDEEDEHDNDKQRRRFVASRHYKIQEVIKRRQIMLVQVVKEERGNKGAALTSYLSLAGRYCVLMPNSARGGGVSRKITSAQDRRRLKEIVGDLELPKNMAVILRTAGAERSKAEIKRDYEYLQRTWNSVREVTMQSRAPALIHEEASLIKRSIRDIYSRDIEEVWVDGEEGYKAAKEFMRVLTPSHAKKVQRYKDDQIPLFHRYQVESQIETINNPSVQLRSGGSIVFGQTEALVAIDVNSGRATRERHIEETAYKTNMEAADEVARQLRLRDLAGLVVIDFIDMEDSRNNHAVERRLKEALRNDRARIQVGRISHFGLLELSRQRLRPSLIETNFKVCNHCGGTGLLRSTESAAVHTLRMLEEEGVKRRSSEVTVTVNPEIALYLLNYKREMLASVEVRYGMKVLVFGDANLIPPNMRLDRVKAERQEGISESLPPPRREIEPPQAAAIEEADDEHEADEEEHVEAPHTHRDNEASGRPSHGHGPERAGEEGEGVRRRRKRRRRRRGGGEFRDENGVQQPRPAAVAGEVLPAVAETAPRDEAEQDGGGEDVVSGEHGEGNRDDQARRGRRRGRRGGRRRRRGGENAPGFGGDHTDGDHAGSEGLSGGHPSGETHNPIEPAFPLDRTHSAFATTHLDETTFPTSPEPEQSSTAEETGNGGRKGVGFFRALKRALTAGETQSEADQPRAETATHVTPQEPKPEPRPEPRYEPYIAPPSPSPEPATEAAPSGPPRRGWWQQPGKTE